MTYTVWIEIEKHPGESEEYERVGEPLAIGTFGTLGEALAAVDAAEDAAAALAPESQV